MDKKKINSMDKLAGQYSPGALRVFGFLSFCLAAFIVYIGIESQRSFPLYEDLVFSEGALTDSQKGRYAIAFSLAGTGKEFRYPSKGRAMAEVWNAVSSGSIARVGYDSKDQGQQTIYELEIDNRSIRSYDEIKAAYKSDNNLIYWLGPAFFISGAFLFWMAQRLEKHLEKEENKRMRRDAGFSD